MQRRIGFAGKVSVMKPHEFVGLVIDSRGLKGTQIAVAIGKPTTQGTISKFLSGKVKDPRSSWVEPAAKLLSISPEAFRSEEAADAEAKRLGLRGTSWAQPIAVKQIQARIDAGMLAVQIADLMRSFDEPTRAAAASLFSRAATHPDEGPAMARRLRGLLAEPLENSSIGNRKVS